MRQIPTSGETTCSGCPCYQDDRQGGGFCLLYADVFTRRVNRRKDCLSDRPQMLTLEDRAALHAKGYEDCMRDREEAKP